MRPLLRVFKPFFGVSVALMVSFVLSCGKNDLSSEGIPDAKKFTEQFVSGDVKGEYYRGKVSIKTSKGNELVIAVNTENTANSITNQLYILQIKKELMSVDNVSFNFDNAEVLYFKNFMIINSLKESKTLYFTVHLDKGDRDYKLLPTNITDRVNETFSGYGLGQLSGAWAMPLDFLRDAEDTYGSIVQYNLSNNKTKSAGAKVAARTCASGGTNSSSCSLTGQNGCSVSCSSGYACCNYVTNVLTANSGCKCI